jgi:hypothetical protein
MEIKECFKHQDFTGHNQDTKTFLDYYSIPEGADI